jgi:hypothetical protein
MKLIAHRGLYDGPNKKNENHPHQIAKAWMLGFECEVDLWMINHELWLGHDAPQYQIKEDFLSSGPLWIHAKNLKALEFLTKARELIYFWHQEDYFTLTSNHKIWTYPGQVLSGRSVMVMPELIDPTFKNLDFSCYGICSDYVQKISELYELKNNHNLTELIHV